MGIRIVESLPRVREAKDGAVVLIEELHSLFGREEGLWRICQELLHRAHDHPSSSIALELRVGRLRDEPRAAEQADIARA